MRPYILYPLVLFFFIALCATLFGSTVNEGFVIDDYSNLLAAQTLTFSDLYRNRPWVPEEYTAKLKTLSPLGFPERPRRVQTEPGLGAKVEEVLSEGQTIEKMMEVLNPGDSWQGVALVEEGDGEYRTVRVRDLGGSIAFRVPAEEIPKPVGDYTYLQARGRIVGTPGNGVVLEQITTAPLPVARRWAHHYTPAYSAFVLALWEASDNANPIRHLVTVVVHAINCVLVFALARTLGLRRWQGMLAAILFCVYAANFEIVAWISAVQVGLATMLILSCSICYLRGRREHGIGWYLLSISLFAAGMLMRESGVFAVALFGLIECSRLGAADGGSGTSRFRSAVFRLLPFALLSGAYVYMKAIVFSGLAQRPGLGRPFLMVFDVPVFQTVNLFFSTHIIERQYLADQPFPTTYAAVWIGVFVLLCALVAVLFIKSGAAVRFGLAWVTVFLVPLSLATAGVQYRYLYLAHAGAAILMVLFFTWVWRQASARFGLEIALVIKIALVGIMIFAVVANTTLLQRGVGRWNANQLETAALARQLDDLIEGHRTAETRAVLLLNFPTIRQYEDKMDLHVGMGRSLSDQRLHDRGFGGPAVIRLRTKHYTKRKSCTDQFLDYLVSPEDLKRIASFESVLVIEYVGPGKIRKAEFDP